MSDMKRGGKSKKEQDLVKGELEENKLSNHKFFKTCLQSWASKSKY